MFQLAFQTHWLEDAIGTHDDPAAIAQSIAVHPSFLEVIRKSIEFADRNGHADKTRIIAEHISFLIHNGFVGFQTMHQP